MTEENWLDDFKKETQITNGKFGHNCEFYDDDFLHHFKILDRMGAQIKIEDYFSIKINLPEANSFDIVIYVLTKLPGCSSASYDKKQHKLYLEWHW